MELRLDSPMTKTGKKTPEGIGREIATAVKMNCREVFVMNAIYCHQQFHLQYYDFHLSLYRELESPFTIIIVLPNQQKSTSKVVIEHT